MIALKTVLVILLSAILFNCSEYPKETEVLRVTDNALSSQTPHADLDVSIGPPHATAQTIITLKIGKTDIRVSKVHWHINGIKDESPGGLRLIPSGNIRKSDIVQAVIIDNDKEYRSNEITIKNTPPAIRKAALIPEKPRVSSTLTVDLKSDDIDGDNVSFKYNWTLNGKFVGDESFLVAELKRDDIVKVEVTPYDGEECGRGVNIEGRIYNSIPVLSETSSSFENGIYTYRLTATDPDKDSLTFKLESGPDGMAVDPSSGVVTWKVGKEHTGDHEAKVMVSDNHGGTLLVPFTTTISFEEEKKTETSQLHS